MIRETKKKFIGVIRRGNPEHKKIKATEWAIG